MTTRGHARMIDGLPSGGGAGNVGANGVGLVEQLGDNSFVRRSIGANLDVNRVLAPSIVDGQNLPAFYKTAGKTLYWLDRNAGANDATSFDYQRNASYTGGTNYFVNTALRVYSTVAATVDAMEWNALFRTDTANDGGVGTDNCAAYAQVRKTHRNGAAWALTTEAIDSGGAQTGTFAQTISIEAGIRAQGATGGSRTGVHMVATGWNNIAGEIDYGFLGSAATELGGARVRSMFASEGDVDYVLTHNSTPGIRTHGVSYNNVEIRGNGTWRMRDGRIDGHLRLNRASGGATSFNELRWQIDATDLVGMRLNGADGLGGGIVGVWMADGQQAVTIARDGIYPGADNARNLGFSDARRWSAVYAVTGTIQTSDEREKTPFRPLAEAERRVAQRLAGMIGLYQWLEAVDRKGEDGARIHIGVGAQAVRDAFAAEGLDAARYGVWCEDPITREETFEVEEDVPVIIERQARDPETGELLWRKVKDYREEPVTIPVAWVDPVTGEPVTYEADEEVEVAVPTDAGLRIEKQTVRVRKQVVLQTPKLDAEGKPVMEAVPFYRDEPQLEVVETTERRLVTRTRRVPDGSRLALRYDQLALWMLAALAPPPAPVVQIGDHA